MVTTNDQLLDQRLRLYRNHGIETDFRQREERGTWVYDMVDLGFNYRLSDISSALGLSQLARLPEWVERRRSIAHRYDHCFADVATVRPPTEPADRRASWHLYPIRVIGEDVSATRARAFEFLRSRGIGVNVHYRPVHLHSYYQRLGYEPGLCPVAEQEYEGLLSLPMWPGLTDDEQDRVVQLVVEATAPR